MTEPRVRALDLDWLSGVEFEEHWLPESCWYSKSEMPKAAEVGDPQRQRRVSPDCQEENRLQYG